MLEESDDGVLWVHDWDEHQPTPRRPSDLPEATRDRKRRSRASHDPGHAESHDVSRVTSRDPSRKGREVEQNPPNPPRGDLPQRTPSKRKRDQLRDEDALRDFAAVVVPEVPVDAAVGLIRSARAHGLRDAGDVAAYVRRYAPGEEAA
jgi:hypothetical protein